MNNDGVNYLEFRKKLKPNYVRVWITLVVSYLVVISVIILSYELSRANSASFQGFTFLHLAFFGLLASFVLGLFFHWINLFLHEASHGGLAKSRHWNDRLGNILCGVWVGESVEQYRLHHLRHHRELGTRTDPENTYFEVLNLKFIFKYLFPIMAIMKRVKGPTQNGTLGNAPMGGIKLIGILIHLLVLLVLLPIPLGAQIECRPS
jgi:fatty acid desaturase